MFQVWKISVENVGASLVKYRKQGSNIFQRELWEMWNCSSMKNEE